MRLHFTPGSSFARIIRVLVRELGLECEEAEITEFPPSPAYFAVNPLGQVPALETDDGTRFPTRRIIDFLMAHPGREESGFARSVRRTPDCWEDDQTLAVLLAMNDALAAIKYQAWAGLEPAGENLLGYDPAERHKERAQRTLDWLESRTSPAGFIPPNLSVQDVALACIILWTEARGGFPWRGRPNLEAIVEKCAIRPSFTATSPQPWP